jgi:type IV pilus assembly protein PilE
MSCRNSKAGQFGFTLIEVMIAVVIVAILASIAVPSFTKQSMRSKRSDALVALQQAAAAQERYYAINSRYVANADPFAGTATITSPEQLYSVAVAVSGATFTATATPVAGTSQASDSDCTSFTLTNTGAKGSTGGYADGGDAGRCWR